MPTEELDTVVADGHPLLRAQLAGQGDLAGEVLTGGGAAGGLVGEQAHGLQLDRDVGDHEGHRLPVGDRLAERLTRLDVGRHVVEHGLPGPDREGAPGQAGEPDALGVRRAVGRAEHGVCRHADPLEAQGGQGGGADAHRGLGLHGQAGGRGLDQEQDRRAVQRGADDEQLGLGAAHDTGLGAVEDEALGGPAGGGRRLEHVEEDRRLLERQGGGRSAVLGEGRQVGLLLGLGAPQAQRRGDRARRQGGQGDAHVALAQGLGHERAGHRRALLGDTAEGLGDAEDRQADLQARLQDGLGGLAGLVGLRGRRAHDLLGVLRDHVDEHLLVLGGREVEDALAGRRGSAGACTLAAGLLELTARGRHRPEALAGAREDDLLGLLAQTDAVEEVALGQLVQRRHGVPDRVTLLSAGQPVPAGGRQARHEALADVHAANVTVSYT